MLIERLLNRFYMDQEGGGDGGKGGAGSAAANGGASGADGKGGSATAGAGTADAGAGGKAAGDAGSAATDGAGKSLLETLGSGGAASGVEPARPPSVPRSPDPRAFVGEDQVVEPLGARLGAEPGGLPLEGADDVPNGDLGHVGGDLAC